MGARTPLPLATAFVALALVVQPNARILGLQPHDSQRVVQVLAYAVVAAWVIATPAVRRRMGELALVAPRTWATVAGMTAVGLLSSALALSPWAGVLEVSLLGATVFTMLAVAAEVTLDTRRATAVILGGVLVACALQLLPLVALPDLSDGTDELWKLGGLGPGGFNHPRFLNQFQAVSLPLLGAVCASARPALRWAARVATVGVAWSLVLTEGRGAVLSLLVVTILLVAVGRGAARRWAAAFTVPAVIGAALAVVTRRLLDVPGLLVARDITSDSGRLEIWARTGRLAAENPIVGVGPGNLAHLDVMLPDVDFVGVPYTAVTHPHNAPLAFAAEWGVPVAVAVVTVLTAIGVALLFRPAHPVRDDTAVVELPVVAAAATAAVGTGLVLSLVSGTTTMPVALTALALAGGLALGLHVHDRVGDVPTRGDTLVGWPIAVVLACAALVLLVEVGPHPRADQAASFEDYVDATGSDISHPRFWLQGVRGLGQS